jgi:RNA polymerase sigma-54 factor
MDISTISRVVNGKYVQTDYGIFELKYFFNEKIETDSGEEISTRRIKNRILEMIEKENPKKPLSDEKISATLVGEGFPVARRTVAKYREQLNIPVARLRKKI